MTHRVSEEEKPERNVGWIYRLCGVTIALLVFAVGFIILYALPRAEALENDLHRMEWRFEGVRDAKVAMERLMKTGYSGG